MSRLRAALFDLDGTLFDTEGQYTLFWGEIARKYRPDIPDLEYRIKGTTLTQIYANYFTDAKVQEEITEALNRYEAQMHFEFVPGALRFLEDLKRNGVKCAVVTSSNKPKMESVARAIPEFHDLFDRVLTSEDFTASKPAPDCYLLGARILDADVSECVVFEDAFTGLEAGMRSGIYTIGVAIGNTRDAIEGRCHHVIDDFRELDYGELCRLLASRG